ncbi:MAG: hypothetical protein FWC36_06280 [Spirochaetes bacterium]|nr:hypothetical protein [Spirochaetota bacterium]
MKPEDIRLILLNECSFFDKNGFDKDIDLYISLIDQKKYKQAAFLYKKRLIPRYPDELTRVRIIRYYRKNDPRFKEIYAEAVREILEKVVISVKKLISYISSTFEGKNNNPYEILKKIDLALRVIPNAKGEGFVFVERLGTYSIMLNYMPENFNTALDILKRYFDNTLFVKVKVETKPVKPEPYSYKPEKKQVPVTIDLDKIVFTEEDIRMICINSDIKPRSLQVLSYCKLYWRQIFNPEFEKKIFLYSKKYDTLHFRIFQIIKSYRIKKITDDVILLEIYSLLSSSYQYNLKEDIFMQRAWRQIKPVDVPESAPARRELPESSQSLVRRDARKLLPEKTAAPTVAISLAAPAEKEKAEKVEKVVAATSHVSAYGQASAAAGAGAVKDEKDKAGEAEEVKRLRNIRYKSDAQIYSIHDRIEKFCLGDYFNAHNEFYELLPKHIDKHLENRWRINAKKDPYILKGASYIIITFITDNYNIVSPDWAESVSKKEVMNIGFDVPELEPIIVSCIEEIRIRRAAA